jgi:hypothetical protein
VVVRAATTLALALALGACGSDPDPDPVDEDTAQAMLLYPDLPHLYGGDQGIYRGCGPNGGVCHNANEFPNLSSVASIVDNIGRDCNQKRESADTLHDMCERLGDVIEISNGTLPIEIASFEPVDVQAAIPRTWKLHLRSAPTEVPTWHDLKVFRDSEDPLYHVGYYMQSMAPDLEDPTGRTIILSLSPPPPNPTDYDAGAAMSEVLASSGSPSDPFEIQVGDPNRNGTFGAERGAKVIKPRDPLRSYLLRRLTDPNAGPLMPRANCCFWTKAALRATWCWIAGLQPDGANALDPIAYATCPASPSVELLYPTPGPECESAGMCPVEAGTGTGEPKFPSIYTEIMVPKCGGMGCHDQEPAGFVDMTSEEAAFQSLIPKVVAGDPAASILYQRLNEDTCSGECETMPLGRPLLPVEDRELIRQWIQDGALRR